VGVLEEDAEREASELHVVDQWCYFGTARTEAEVPELLADTRRLRFDPDQYKILAKHLASRRARVLELPCVPA